MSSSAPKGGSGSIRRTQRPPKSCSECARKKMKCSPSIPCVPCLELGRGAACKRETVLVKGQVVNGSSDSTTDSKILQLENATLRSQIAELEKEIRVLRRKVPLRVTEPQDEGNSSDYEIGDRIDYMIRGLEFLSMGLSPTPDTSYRPDPASPSARNSLNMYASPRDMLRSLLPSQPVTQAVLDYSYQWTWWRSCGYHVPTFQRQVEACWSTDGMSADWSWVGLLMAIMAVGVYYMGTADAHQAGFTDEQVRELPDLYIRAMVQSLFNANFLFEPSLISVQTICIACDILNALGLSSLGTCLLAIAIRHSQSMNLHLLGSEPLCALNPNGTCHLHGVSAPHFEYTVDAINRETSRRVWLSILITEYNSLLAREKHGVPAHGDSIPLNFDDVPKNGLVVVKPVSHYTMVSHHLLMRDLAFTVHRYFTESDYLQGVMTPGSELRRLFERFSMIDNQLPHSCWSRYIFVNGVHHRRLLLLRKLFARSFREAQFEIVRSSALDAAHAIRATRRNDFPSRFGKTWALASSALTACVFLAIDLFHTPATDPNLDAKRSDIIELYNAMNRGFESNPFVNRASSLVQWLLSQEVDFRAIYLSQPGESAPLQQSSLILERPVSEPSFEASSEQRAFDIFDFIGDFDLSGEALSGCPRPADETGG